VQIATGALATFLVGVLADLLGLRPVMLAATLVPLSLLWICREPRPAGPAGVAPSPSTELEGGGR